MTNRLHDPKQIKAWFKSSGFLKNVYDKQDLSLWRLILKILILISVSWYFIRIYFGNTLSVSFIENNLSLVRINFYSLSWNTLWCLLLKI